MGGTRLTNSNHSNSPSPVNPGTTGINDAADPGNLDIPLGSPGSTGLNDRADRTNNGTNILDAAYFPHFSAWFEITVTSADHISGEAAEMRLRIPESNRTRLNIYIDNVVTLRNELDNEVANFERTRRSNLSPASMSNKLEELDQHISVLAEILASWDAVLSARLIELLETIGRSQLAQARRLQTELQDLQRLTRELASRESGDEMGEVAAQVAINTAIGVIGSALAVAAGPFALLVVVAGGVAQLGVDQLLGPDDVGGLDLSTTAASSYGDAREVLQRSSTELADGASQLSRALRSGARLVGPAGTVIGAIDDAAEFRQAAQRASDARVALTRIPARIRAVNRRLTSLLPILAFPNSVRAILNGMLRESAVLRRHGQLALNS